MVFQIGFAAGLLALLILVPLIIIYLRKPKALAKPIPSLMFFSEHKGSVRVSSFLRKFIRNILFLIQLLVLALLAFSCSQPSVTNERLVFLQHSIIVLDTSASASQSFDELIVHARRNVAAETSIVIATTPNEVLLERATPDRAIGVLQQVRPTDRRSDLSGGLLRAISLAQDPARIVIITDRRSSLSQAALDLAENQGHRVAIIDASTPIAENIGFTDARVSSFDVDVAIRNFGPERSVTVRGPASTVSLDIPERGLRRVTLPLVEGENVFTLEPQGGFDFDSTLFVSNPARSSLSALIVSVADGSLPVERALRASNRTQIDIARNRLGTVNQAHDLLVLTEYSTELILPSFYNEARNAVEQGAILVISKNTRWGSIPDDLMPVEISGVREGTYAVSGQGSSIIEAVEFTEASDPLEARLRNGSISLARSGDTQIMAMMPKGAGAIIYYGYDDQVDQFVNTPYYPIFWSNVIEELTGARTVGRANVETGARRTLAYPTRVEFPDGRSDVVSTVAFDRVGFYRTADATFAVNTLESTESDPSFVLEARDADSDGSSRSPVEVSLIGLLAVLALLAVLFEVFILKKRGEL